MKHFENASEVVFSEASAIAIAMLSRSLRPRFGTKNAETPRKNASQRCLSGLLSRCVTFPPRALPWAAEFEPFGLLPKIRDGQAVCNPQFAIPPFGLAVLAGSGDNPVVAGGWLVPWKRATYFLFKHRVTAAFGVTTASTFACDYCTRAIYQIWYYGVYYTKGR